MVKHSVMIDLDDPRAEKLAEVMTNPTSKKILGAMAEKEEMSISEIASALGIPVNTAQYNVEKLLAAGLIEEGGKFLWSVKGKRIMKYKISNKKIVISPTTKMKGIVPAVLVTGIVAAGIWIWSRMLRVGFAAEKVAPYALEKTAATAGETSSVAADGANSVLATVMNESARGASEAAACAVQNQSACVLSSSGGFFSWFANTPNAAAWFFIGGLTALFIFLLWNWSKNDKV